MVALKAHKSNPYKQVVHLYPDGEVRYQVSLCHKERLNDTGMSAVVQQTLAKKKIRASKSSKVCTEKKVKPGWGELSKPKSFTKYAKNTIRRTAGALQLEFGRDNLAFCTLTVPGGKNEVIETIAKYSGYLMNRIQTWLTDNYQHSNGKKYVLGVVELQKRGMLHWHFLVALEDKLLIDEFRNKVEEFWYRLLIQLSENSGVDVFERRQGDSWRDRYEEIKNHAVDVQPVYKNASAYMAKYMSKGYKKAKNWIRNIYYTPSSWWTCSRDAMAVTQSWTVSYQLTNVDEQFIKKELIPGIKEFFDDAKLWQVEMFDKYRKEVCGLIGRGTYEQCKEWCDVIIPVLNRMCECHELENIKYQRLRHTHLNELLYLKREYLSDRKELRADELRLRKQYFKLVNEFKMSPDDAYKTVFGKRIATSLEAFGESNKPSETMQTKLCYNHKLRCLVEVENEEYLYLRLDSA